MLNSLWPSDDKWRHTSGSTSAQIMVCCLAASNRHRTNIDCSPSCRKYPSSSQEWQSETNTCRTDNNLALSVWITDNIFRESSYSYDILLLKCPLYRQCFALAGHSEWWSLRRIRFLSLQRRHNGRYGVSTNRHHECLLNRLFRHQPKKTSKLRVTGLCEGNSSVTGEFPAHIQRASNAENVSIWWRHRGIISAASRHSTEDDFTGC